MSDQQLHDASGAAVTVDRDPDAHSPGAFRVVLADDGRVAGRTVFLDRDDAPEPERVFFHTEVDDDLTGRGLATVLVREALRVTADEGRTVVPVCPLVAAHLRKHPDDPAVRHRAVRPADVEWVQARLRGGES